MQFQPGLFRLESLDVDAIRRNVESEGYDALVMPSKIRDRDSFFDAVRATLPLEPPLASNRSWDALSDSLWQGLYEHPSQKIAIIWPGTQLMASAAAEDLVIALDVLADVANSLADSGLTGARPKAVVVLVERQFGR